MEMVTCTEHVHPNSIVDPHARETTRDAYAEIAGRYDRFHGRFDQHDPAEVRFFSELFERNGVHCVLDCACGTGRHLHLFHKLGLESVGSDLSPAMLDQARENLSSVGIDVPLVKADYRCLAQVFECPFDAVVCLSSSLLHMADDAQALEALQSMHAVLRESGLLVLSQGTTDKRWRQRQRFILAVDEPQFTRLFVIDYRNGGARYNLVDISRGQGLSELSVWSVEYGRVLLHEDYQKLLREAGFEEASFLGSFNGEPYDRHQSDRLVVVAHK